MKKFKIIAFVLSFVATTTMLPLKTVHGEVQTSITRYEAEQRALQMINLNWTYSNSRNGNNNLTYGSSVTKPAQFTAIDTAQVSGIPYDWGGLDGIDLCSYDAPWGNFLDAINKGAFAGNVNTEAGYGYIPGTTGIDCSGFVQATFHISFSKLSTSTLFDEFFTKIPLTDIKHMDILNKPGDHVVIFDQWGTQNGVYGAFTYECTPDQAYGGIQGTKKYFMTMDEINKGYIPGRYINLVENSTTPLTPIAPIAPAAPPITASLQAVTAGIFAQVSNVTSYANFRSNPSITSTIIGTIPKDALIYLIRASSGWYQVSYNGQLGWISGNLLSSIPSGKYVNVNSVSQLNIRTAPTTTSTILGVLTQNQYAEVLEYSNDGKWMKIKINGVEGFASSKYLSYIY